jgi:hypothetical protein
MQDHKMRACLSCLVVVLPISSTIYRELASRLDLGLSSMVLLVARLGTQPHSGRSFPFRQVTLINVLTTGGIVNSLTEKSSNKMRNGYMGDQL